MSSEQYEPLQEPDESMLDRLSYLAAVATRSAVNIMRVFYEGHPANTGPQNSGQVS